MSAAPKEETPSGQGKGFQGEQQKQQAHFTARFTGTDNPRHLRAIAALLRRPMPRESLDRESGASNGPDLVAELRRRGLAVPCERISFIDRDGYACNPGVYHLTARDRRKIRDWKNRRAGAAQAPAQTRPAEVHHGERP